MTLEKENECSICYISPDVRGKIDSCDHFFCVECIVRWSHSANTCPQCRTRFHTISRVQTPSDSSDLKQKNLKHNTKTNTKKRGMKRQNREDVEEYTPDTIRVCHRDQRPDVPDIADSFLFFRDALLAMASRMSRRQRSRQLQSSRLRSAAEAAQSEPEYIDISE